MYPTLFLMVMDYLPIQASSISCEHVFSSSSETDTMRRKQISPLMMEALQMLKFHLKKRHLSFTQGWVMSEKEMLDDANGADLLVGLLKEDFHADFDKIMKFISDEEGEL